MGKYSSYSDTELVRRLKGKNANIVFEELYNRYWKKLLFQALLRLNAEVEAEEVVQDVFTDLWARRKNLEIRKSFHTYMASCVKYQIMSKLAQRKKRIKLEQEIKMPLGDRANDTEAWLDYESTRKYIEDTVQSLPEKCRLVFRLSREEGYSQKEIADKLKISTKTVETHISKALKKIRSSFKHYFFSLF